MARRIIDISVSLQAGIKSDPPGGEPQIHYETHQESIPRVLRHFPGLTVDELPDREGWATEQCKLSTHNGTHVDAPYHYATTMDHGKPAMRIDEAPLEWFHQPGVKLDFRHFPNGYVVTAGDIETELKRITHTLKPLEIVVVNTAAGARYGYDDYVPTGCGMGREATLYLTSRGIRVVGTDAWSWDAPFVYTANRYAETKDPSIIWEGHRSGREIGYCQIEKLSHLDQLPTSGFQVVCFPVKVKGGSAGWTRAVAIIE